jgi:hypothetical protein
VRQQTTLRPQTCTRLDTESLSAFDTLCARMGWTRNAAMTAAANIALLATDEQLLAAYRGDDLPPPPIGASQSGNSTSSK